MGKSQNTSMELIESHGLSIAKHTDQTQTAPGPEVADLVAQRVAEASYHAYVYKSNCTGCQISVHTHLDAQRGATKREADKLGF